MLSHVLYFQFAFMYLLALVMGLVVYGSDFDGITGWLYVMPLIALAIFHKKVWSRRSSLYSVKIIRTVGVIAALAALIAYAPMHMGYWDEHSINQAFWMAVLGVCSYLISVVAATDISKQETPCQYCAPGALALIGVFWLLARYYPMVILFFLSVLFVVYVVWFSPQQVVRNEPAIALQTDTIAKYTLFLLAIDIGCIIWDYEVNAAWGLYVGAAFIAGAVGYYIKLANNSSQLEQTVYIAAIANFLLAVAWPTYVLWSLHAVVAGFCMGYLLPHAISQRVQDGGELCYSLGWVVWLFLGLVLSNAWYANLQWAFTRVMVVLPFLILGVVYVKYRIAVTHSK